MKSGLDERIEFALDTVNEQKALFTKYFGRVASDWKQDGSRVTAADHALSDALRSAIAGRFPEDVFLSEETPAGERPVESEFVWLVDPIDGTNNFARGLNTCSISVGILRDGEPIYGVIYDHSFKAIFHGGPQKGLWIDGQAVHPHREAPSNQSIIASQEYNQGAAIKDSAAITSRFKTRALGSSALHLAYVAAGYIDGSIAHMNYSWDIAAGVALLKSVGSDIHYLDFSPFPIKSFDTSSPAFGYITGSSEVITAIRDTIGR